MSNEFADYKQQMLGTSSTNGETRKIKTDNNGVLQTSLVGSLTNIPVDMATSLSKDLDSIDVGKMSKGGVVVAHNAIVATATSAEIPTEGFNSILVHCNITSGTWTVGVQGAVVSGATFVDNYDGATKQEAAGLTASRNILFRGITDFTKIVATMTAAGTATFKVQPLNL